MSPETYTLEVSKSADIKFSDCCLVSKAWRDRVRSNSLLWQDLDFPRPLRLQDRARVKRCVQLAGAGRTRLRMVGHEDVVREAYKPGFKLPENIWSLTLLHEHTVITSGVMMKQWGFLGERIAKSTALRVLEISCAMSATQLIALMDKFRSLEVLQLGNIIVDRGTGPDIKLGDQQYGLRSLRMGILDYDELVPVGNSLMVSPSPQHTTPLLSDQ